MIVIPAVDIKGGRCVRLKQGRMSEETVYSDDPVQAAMAWCSKGAERIHLVDLDGAVGGKRVNAEVIRAIARSVPVPVELGGGIRTLASVEFYLQAGVEWVILGTAALKDPGVVHEACRNFPGHVMLAIDARGGRVAVEGWTEDTERSAAEVARPFEGQGIAAVIYTDIQRDGMSVGPNLQATGELAKALKTPVIASGGISCLEDIRKVLTLSAAGVTGVITGRALYEGTLNLEEAIRVVKESKIIS
ncbi:MAG: 1-(5-phosphoribosyl)-5-[(5-phosphoribosylamino)methylideneamino]imidazole-4-carboxamide isomerase [Desulfobacterota bacterium]|jgi:phosphoribosylformimino-5-aminoimidazole carboxamide ribotide isomerase|nr:1-(5-phosphoribosyl)-5-[(5-phosphoribosylamino)methylideneamino]imidazole-4-carboxamide isomerase [Thermodesulfobacteriota bacterium]